MSAGYTPTGRAHQASSVLLHGRGLLLARATLLVVAVLVVGLFLRAMPLLFRDVQVVCTGRTCQRLKPDAVQQLQALGMSRSA